MPLLGVNAPVGHPGVPGLALERGSGWVGKNVKRPEWGGRVRLNPRAKMAHGPPGPACKQLHVPCSNAACATGGKGTHPPTLVAYRRRVCECSVCTNIRLHEDDNSEQCEALFCERLAERAQVCLKTGTGGHLPRRALPGEVAPEAVPRMPECSARLEAHMRLRAWLMQSTSWRTPSPGRHSSKRTLYT